MTRSIIFLIVLLLLSASLMAQEEEKKSISFTLFAGVSLPDGYYGEPIGVNAGLTRRFGFQTGELVGAAKTGFGTGVECMTEVLTENLYWSITAQFIANPIDDTEITALFRHQLGDTSTVAFENGTWMHIPVMTGLSYALPLGGQFRLFVTLQGGLNITQQASRKASVDGTVVEETTFDWTPNFGYQAGLGIEFLRSYHLVFRYVDLDTPRYEGTRVPNVEFFPATPRKEMDISGDARSVSMFFVALGYTL